MLHSVNENSFTASTMSSTCSAGYEAMALRIASRATLVGRAQCGDLVAAAADGGGGLVGYAGGAGVDEGFFLVGEVAAEPCAGHGFGPDGSEAGEQARADRLGMCFRVARLPWQRAYVGAWMVCWARWARRVWWASQPSGALAGVGCTGSLEGWASRSSKMPARVTMMQA